MSPSERPLAAPVAHFDGRSAAARPVSLVLVQAPDGLRLRILDSSSGQLIGEHAADRLDWPEHQRHGPRLLHLPDGGQLHCHQGAAWDRWALQRPGGRPWIERLQQSWRATALALLACVLALGLMHALGLPLLARGVLVLLPESVDASIGQATLAEIDQHWCEPSRLPDTTAQRLGEALARAQQQRADQGGPAPVPVQVRLCRSREQADLGPNALALPGGTILVTDALVELLHDREDVLLGVLAHEAGHVRHRHGMRLLVQATLLGAASSVLFGDFGSLAGQIPLLLGQLAYSREAEREADDEAIVLLRAAGLSPAVMVTLFERLAGPDGTGRDNAPPIALASHPADAERIARFQQAADAR